MTGSVDATSRAEIVVDLDAIRDNATHLRSVAAPAQLMAVVKADGYGHGMTEAARAARAGGADWLGVAVIEEALALRAAGDRGPVLCWLAVPGEDYAPAVAADVDVTAYDVAQVDAVARAAASVGRTARLQLKVDTGLSRGGATREQWPAVVAAARAAQDDGLVEVTGVWSHLACSDEPTHPANDAQEKAFAEAVAVVHEAGLRPMLHLANSAAALTRPSARLDLVRCGIALYGCSPAPEVADSAGFGLRPAMTVTSRLALVKQVPSGAGVSYGHTYTVPGEPGSGPGTRVAVVPVGYGDGVPRAASSRAPVLAGGVWRTIAGRVCMDQFVLDVGEDQVAAGDRVVLFGDGTDGGPTAQDWAEACGTISYEIVTCIGGRFRRRHVGHVGEGT